jgi:uncharacterized RDD family membrane protein YckC
MSIKILKSAKDEKYAGSFKRSGAATIDMWIVLFLRVLVMQFLGAIWLNPAIIKFMEEFKEHFGTETIKNTREHIDFVINSRVFIYGLIFYSIVILVGALYHAFLNSSAWKGTIGKRLMKITIVEESGEKISFYKGLAHYFLSVLPFVYILYLISFQVRSGLDFYQTIMSSEINVFLGILFLLWVQIHLFTKKKTTAYDLICRTVLVKEKTAVKWPWSKTSFEKGGGLA